MALYPHGMEASNAEYERLEEAFSGLEAPFAFVDLDAMQANAETVLTQAGAKPVRVASKSVRSRAILDRIFRDDPRVPGAAGFRGLLTFTLAETLYLAEQGWRDLVLAYPTTDRDGLARLAELTAEDPTGAPVVMVDSTAHLDLIEEVTGPGDPAIRVAIDLDAGYRPLGDLIRIGVKRSGVHTVEEAVSLAGQVAGRRGLDLVGLMAYEAQVAGLGDRPAGKPVRGAAIRWMQRRSAREIAERRAAAVEEVGKIARLEFVNGGGTGSISLTAAEPAVTEVAAGSGFFAPVQFDYYDRIALSPAAGFALPVVRIPRPGIATVAGGGYLASGPGDGTRLPVPWLPAGLQLDREEGAGEVQTPLLGEGTRALGLGDRAYFRHVKAGELCERFNSLYLVEGDRVVDEVPTYRGEGLCFL